MGPVLLPEHPLPRGLWWPGMEMPLDTWNLYCSVGAEWLLWELEQSSQEIQQFLPPSLSPHLYLQGQESPENSLTHAHLEFSFPKPQFPASRGRARFTHGVQALGQPLSDFPLPGARLKPPPHCREPIIRAPSTHPIR